MMITIIIAGGSGSRLWPLSTPDYPKHLLKINGHDQSLLRNTYDRVKKISKSVYVVTEISHARHVKDQLPELAEGHIIIEPARRGTASCIVAGLNYVTQDNNIDETVAFVAADHHIRDVKGFAHSFKIAEKVSVVEQRIVLIGVEPDSPETGFGYIHKGKIFDKNSLFFEVKSFKEKPDFTTAKKYIKSGEYLWNCSYFVAPIKTFLSVMQKNSPELYSNYLKLNKTKTQAEFNTTYMSFENIAIDYALIEKVPDLLVVPASFDWMDLGSYGDLHKAVDSDEQGNHIYGNIETDEVENSFIQNFENEKPVAVIGLDNIVVINTPHGIVVARKDLAQKVGDVSKRFKK